MEDDHDHWVEVHELDCGCVHITTCDAGHTQADIARAMGMDPRELFCERHRDEPELLRYVR